MVDGRGNSTLFLFDGFDRKVGEIDAVGDRLTWVRDANGNVVTESRFGPTGGPSPTDSSGSGNVLLSQRELHYDELNRMFQQDDLLFLVTRTIRPVALLEGPLVYGDGKVSTRFIYDRNSRLIKEIQDDLDTTITEYDGVNRVVRRTDPEGNQVVLTYDGNDNVIQQVEIEQSQKAGLANETFSTTFQYDALDRLTKTSDNCRNTMRYAYDSRNNRTHSTDAKVDRTVGCPGVENEQGNSMRYTFDGANRRLQAIRDLRVDGLGGSRLDTSNAFNPDAAITTVSTWDGNSRLVRQTDDNGNVTRYTYDALNRILTETFADTTTKRYGYDANDNVVTHQDQNGTIQTCRYDLVNRKTRCDIARASGVIGTTLTVYEYDGLSRLTKLTDNNDPANLSDDSVVTRTYDSLSRLVEETQNGKVVSADWFGGERRSGLTYPNGRALALAFDQLDRMKSIQDSGRSGNLVEYDYMGPQRVLERRFPNGVRETYLDNAGTTDVGYDGIKRVIQLRHVRATTSQLVVGFQHAYDREHNKRFEDKQHSPANSELYAYDSVYRLTNFQRGQLTPAKDGIQGIPNRQQQWTLDGVHNWRQTVDNGALHVRTVNETNEYVKIDSNTVTYDANGNITNDGSTGFRWDDRNRLSFVCRLDPNNPAGADGILGTADDCAASGALPIATYSYDAMNRRIRKVVTNSGLLNGMTSFYYDDWRTIEERTGSDVVTNQYVYGVEWDELLVLDRNLNGDASATGVGDLRLFYHQNTLYSVFALTDNTGTIMEAYQYDPYGQETVFTLNALSPLAPAPSDAPNLSNTIANPYLFTGQRLDAETGLYYYKNRYYSSSLGRFLTRDPIGIWDDAENVGNGYTYVGNRPTIMTDPSGQKPKAGESYTHCVDRVTANFTSDLLGDIAYYTNPQIRLLIKFVCSNGWPWVPAKAPAPPQWPDGTVSWWWLYPAPAAGIGVSPEARLPAAGGLLSTGWGYNTVPTYQNGGGTWRGLPFSGFGGGSSGGKGKQRGREPFLDVYIGLGIGCVGAHGGVPVLSGRTHRSAPTTRSYDFPVRENGVRPRFLFSSSVSFGNLKDRAVGS